MIIVHIKYTNNSLADYWCICFHGISLLTWGNNIRQDNRMANSHAVHCRQRRWFHEKTVVPDSCDNDSWRCWQWEETVFWRPGSSDCFSKTWNIPINPLNRKHRKAKSIWRIIMEANNPVKPSWHWMSSLIALKRIPVRIRRLKTTMHSMLIMN